MSNPTQPVAQDPSSLKKANETYREKGFQELETRLQTLINLLGEALDPALLPHLPWRNEAILHSSENATVNSAKSSQLQAICFEILNMVEERTALQVRHRRTKELGLAAEKGLWAETLSTLKAEGLTEDEVLAILPKVCVTPVLTAHPTEAKRPTVRERHLAIYKDLVDWDQAGNDTAALQSALDSLKVNLETLWHTGEIHAEAPTLLKELRHAIYYLREVFPRVIRTIDASLEAAWIANGWDIEKLRAPDTYPTLKFGTWIGGDRDGHPYVTAAVTEDTLRRLRKHSFRIHERELRNAAHILTLSPAADKVPATLTQRIAEISKELKNTEITELNESVPWRCLTYLIREKLVSKNNGYQHPDDYKADLELLDQSLIAFGATSTARRTITPLKRLLKIFGFHLAELDIRQNSEFHDNACAQMLTALGVAEGDSYPDWDEQKRVDYLLKELSNDRPWRNWRDQVAPGSEADQLMGCLRVLRKHSYEKGFVGIGIYIISMTRQLSDMLLVHLFAREGELATWTGTHWVSKIPVCPLFETGEDLDNAAGIIKNYLSLENKEALLRTDDHGNKHMPIMVGYSDSTKDSGILSGQWSLQKALTNVTNVCLDAGTTGEFFHGRGGTISRGAGPTSSFLKALPAGSLGGAMRLTEQGEVIPQKYSHHSAAAYNLELLVAGSTGVTAINAKGQNHELSDKATSIMDQLGKTSRAHYQALLQKDRFMEFYRQATPLDALENGCFGSRPSRRTGASTLNDLRAIPWVFSWTQSRYYISGWYGVGEALYTLREESPADFETLAEIVKTSPFIRYFFTNVETNLASADRDLMNQYADLVEDPALREDFQSIILRDYDRTVEMIDAIFGSPFAERRPRMVRTLGLRQAPLKALHLEQISLLKSWRADPKNPELLTSLQFSVNAIASGLKTTG